MTKHKELPVLPIRDPEIIIFPGQVCEIDVARSFSVNAITSSREEFGDRIIIAMQKNCDVSMPNEEDFYSICVEAEIKESTVISSGETKRIRLIVLGLSRCSLVSASLKNGSHYVGTIEKIVEPDFILSDELRAQLEEAKRVIKKNFSASVSLKNPNTPQTSVELSEMVDDVASQLNLKQKEKLDLLKQKDPRKRLEKLYKYMSELIIQRSVNNSCKNHSEDEDGVKGEIEKLEELLKGANLPPEALKIAEQEIRRLKMMSPSSSEFQVTLNYVDNLVTLPWDKSSDDTLDLDFAKKCLDEDHYGLEKVKERILEFLAVRKLAPNQKGSILCLAGPPGTGKAQPLDALVLTPTGYITMGEVAVGTEIMTPSGDVAKVTGVFPQGIKDIYKVGFSDGANTECCEEHLWQVYSKRKHMIVSLKQLKELNQTEKYSIPLPQNVNNLSNDLQKSFSNLLNKLGDKGRVIENISFIGRKEAQCIYVDHHDHLYITNDFIVTHNTSICKSVARSMSKEYVRISLGGLHDEAEIRGHRKTYIGAMPGRIIQSLKKVGVNNPIFVLDEIDKLSKDYRGDPSSALLEVLDPEQNNTFQDNYINTPFDLSKVFFITTANDLGTIPQALRDRLEIIEIPGYSPFDKIRIAQNYLIPKQKKENGVGDLDVSISENAISKIIEEYTSEAGVRRLEKYCGTIMRKIAVQVASNKKPQTNVSVNLIPKFLGVPKVFADKANEQPLVGVSTGMAWSQNGGSILFVETMFTPGNGNIKVTGSVGKVLEESANAAFTWIRSHASEYGVDLEKIASHDIHIHLPAGATPKDGPSAGIAITSAMLSTIVDLPVANDVSMTGEISLRGRVLPIGGLKEKVLAAHRAGIKKVIFPKDNSFDLEEIPKDVLAELEMIPVSELSEAIPILIASIEHPKKYCGTEPICSLEN